MNDSENWQDPIITNSVIDKVSLANAEGSV